MLHASISGTEVPAGITSCWPPAQQAVLLARLAVSGGQLCCGSLRFCSISAHTRNIWTHWCWMYHAMCVESKKLQGQSPVLQPYGRDCQSCGHPML